MIRILLPLLLFISIIVHAQVTVDINSGNPAFPFPQFLPYEFGENHSLGNLGTQWPEGVTHAEMEQDIRDAWQIMANRFEYTGEEHQGVKYILSNNGCPYDCTEGVGYAMIGAAYMGDKTTFDGIWFRSHDTYLLKNKRYIDGIIPRSNYNYGDNIISEAVSSDAATDGSEDMALGLLMAWKQWGENSGYTTFDGDVINYKEEALKVIRGLVEKRKSPYISDPSDCRSLSGIVGFDGYVKNGNTWSELTDWANNNNDWCPEFKGPQDLHVDYVAPSYYNNFARFLEQEGGSQEDLDWNINQFLRAEASSDWLVGQHYNNSPSSILSAGWVSLDNNNKADFSNFNEGEDFRFSWRTSLNYVWNGNPSTTWNPFTHQTESTTNTFEKDMAIRHASFLKDNTQEPWNNDCKRTSGENASLYFFGPSQLLRIYTPEGNIIHNDFTQNWNAGSGSPTSIAAQDYDLMAELYKKCVLEWVTTKAGDKYLTSVPRYFDGWFRLLGMLTLTGNMQAPMNIEPKANLKVYQSVSKTYAFTDDTITYTIDYRNYGSLDANNVIIKANTDPNTEVISVSGNGSYNPSNNSITWNLASLPGYKTGKLDLTKGKVIYKVIAKDSEHHICHTAKIISDNGYGSISPAYPNNYTSVMERNCVDVLGKGILIKKTYTNPDNLVDTFLVRLIIENPETDLLKGGRSNVILSMANDGNTSYTNRSFKLFHGAEEPYINYGNYRVSLFLNDNFDCINYNYPECTNGLVLNLGLYEGGDENDLQIRLTNLKEGQDDRGKWNNMLTLELAEQEAATTPHLMNNYGNDFQIHRGTSETLHLIFNSYGYNIPEFNSEDDWSWNTYIEDQVDGLYLPISPSYANTTFPSEINKRHPYICEESTQSINNVLVEEWDGSIWRKVIGNAPISGIFHNSVKVTDQVNNGFEFVKFQNQEANLSYSSENNSINWSLNTLQPGYSDTIYYYVKKLSDVDCELDLLTSEIEISSTELSPRTFIFNSEFDCSLITDVFGKSISEELSVYPTVINNHVKIKCNLPTSYEIININGQVVTKGTTHDKITRIDFSNYEKGMYLLRAEQKTIKLIKL